jgi:hypothetical protein
MTDDNLKQIKFDIQNVEDAARNILNTNNLDRMRFNTFFALGAIAQALASIDQRLEDLEKVTK